MAYSAADDWPMLDDQGVEPYIDPVTGLNNIDAILEDSRSGQLSCDDGDDVTDDFWI